jgi:acetylornithine deacetylase/succinyl-diaminopimelate desuccinylase-like protein
MKSNIKFAFEGEEEAGSPNFAKTLAANKALFAGDIWLNCNGPVHQSRRSKAFAPQLYFEKFRPQEG